MKILLLLKLVFLFMIASCASEPIGVRPNYFYVRFASQIDDIYRFEITPYRNEYCSKRDLHGNEYYSDSCIKNGIRIFSNTNDSKSEVENVARQICHSEVQYVGYESTKEFSGNSPVSCNTNKIFGSLLTNCNGGVAQFDYITRVFYKCVNSNSLSNSNNKINISNDDFIFLKKMLDEKKITKEKYEEILNGTKNINPSKTESTNIPSSIYSNENKDKKKDPIDEYLDN